MLNFIYYPVSFILWCWHKVFGFVLGDANAFGWALSIVFLVFTLRAILLKPAINQVRSMRKMQEFAPQMKAIQKKYANDRQRQSQEMQKLQREHGVNPLGGCLPMVLQIPVFIGLNHVLRTFTQYPNRPNYFFPLSDVKSYLDAKLFGAHLGDAIFNTSLVQGATAHHETWTWGVAPVAIPLMIVASIATHFTARLSVQRNMNMNAAGSPQSAMMSKLTMWVFPLGVLAFGGALPVGLLLYWVSNNIWTLGQQHFVFGRMDREEEEKKRRAQEHRDSLAPRPGQKPGRPKKTRPAAGGGEVSQPAAKNSGTGASKERQKPREAVNTNGKPGAGSKPAAGAKPAPGAKPATGKKPAPGAKPAAGKKPAPGAKPAQPKKRSDGEKKRAATTASGKNGKPEGGAEIPGLISDRTRKKKQQGRKAR